MRKISVIIANRHQTSITLEEPFYEQLQKIAKERGIGINALVTEIDRNRTDYNLSGAVRVYILQYLLKA